MLLLRRARDEPVENSIAMCVVLACYAASVYSDGAASGCRTVIVTAQGFGRGYTVRVASANSDLAVPPSEAFCP